jgi:hypothetical protein
MKTLSTLFIAAAFALSMMGCGGGSEAEAAESQSDDTTMTTGDETGSEDAYGTEEETYDEALPAEEESLEEAPAEEGAEDEAAEDEAI